MRTLWFLLLFLLVPEPTPAASLNTVAVCGFTPYIGTPSYSSCIDPWEFASASASYGELHTLTIALPPGQAVPCRRAHPFAWFTDEIVVYGPGDFVFADVHVLNEPDGNLFGPEFRFARATGMGPDFDSVSAFLHVGEWESIEARLDGYLAPGFNSGEGTFKIVRIDLRGRFGETTGYTYETASGASYPFSNARHLVPEPSTVLLCGAGLVLCLFLKKKQAIRVLKHPE